jgi:formylglycine-generating enzyme required for sulfatase activity/heme/copper-type cytochrome/quinol oxidase subunit 2
MTGQYYGALIIAIAALAITGLIIYRLLKKGDEMLAMMAGMTIGMLSGVAVGTFVLLPTGNFLAGVMIGSIVGILFGVPIGRFGGFMGIMEGLMAGWMGGMMGAMLGQMMRPFNLNIFMPFFFILFFITIAGLIYLVHSRSKKRVPLIISRYGAVAAVIALIAIVNIDFSITPKASPVRELASSGSGIIEEEVRQRKKMTAKINDNGVQEIEIVALNDNYYPKEVIIKKGASVRVTLKAGKHSGCLRDFVLPSFNINKIIPTEGSTYFDFTPKKNGEIPFRCSMDMYHGKFVVVDEISEAPVKKSSSPAPLPSVEKLSQFPSPIGGEGRVRGEKSDMVLIPSGEFTMGSSEKEIVDIINKFGGKAKPVWYKNETPQKKVFVKGFYIDRYEVTNSQYKRFKSDHVIPFDRENHPAVNVKWAEADAYCRWLGKRLPTEEEWEKAARGTDARQFPWGNDFDKAKANTAASGLGGEARVGSYKEETTASLFPGGTVPIGSLEKGASPYGVHDMSGNAWEWTDTWYDKEKGLKVLKGGSWIAPPISARSAVRLADNPFVMSNDYGFRCASDKI